MKHLGVVVVACLAPVLGASPEAAARDTVDVAALRRAGYEKRWETNLPLQRGDRPAAVCTLDDTLYVSTVHGEMLAVHRGVGLVRWVRHLTERGMKMFAPSHVQSEDGGGPVVIATASGIGVIDRYSGELLQDIPPTFAFGSPAVADGSRVFVGSSDGHLYAVLWRDPGYSKATLLWRVMAGGPVSAAPVWLDADHLYFASQGGSVYCCTTEAKILNWQFPTGGAIVGDIHVDPDGVYVSSTDRSVYRLDPISGAPRWRRRLSDILRDGPIVVRGTVYQYCEGFGLYAIDAEFGDVLWHYGEGLQFAASSGTRACLATRSGGLAVVEAKTGRLLGEVPLPAGARVAVNREDGAVYVLLPDGGLVSARPEGEAPLSPREITHASATLNRSVDEEAAGPTPVPSPEGPGRDAPGTADDPLRSRRHLTPVGGKP